jgi:Bacterial sugar transferase
VAHSPWRALTTVGCLARSSPGVTWNVSSFPFGPTHECPSEAELLFYSIDAVAKQPDEVADYGALETRRLQVRPGMTGLWQVSGRSTFYWNETLRLDLRYVDNWALGSDFHLLWRTVGVGIRGTGAY